MEKGWYGQVNVNAAGRTMNMQLHVHICTYRNAHLLRIQSLPAHTYIHKVHLKKKRINNQSKNCVYEDRTQNEKTETEKDRRDIKKTANRGNKKAKNRS